MKKSPQTCGSMLCCKASAELKEEIENELKTPDKSLATILGERTHDLITDDAPPAPKREDVKEQGKKSDYYAPKGESQND